MKLKSKNEKRKIIVGINIDKKGPLEKEDVEKAVKTFKEYYTNYKGKING